MADSYWTTVRRSPWATSYWRLNEGTGIVDATDSASRFGLTGIYSGRTPGPALIQADSTAGSSVLTAGSVTVSDATPLHITGDISIEAWVVPYSVSLTGGILGKRNAANTFANPYALTIRTGQLSFELGNGSTSVIVTGGVVPLIPTHVLATCFRGAIKLYINRVQVASGSLGSQAVTDGGQPLVIGAFGSTPGVDLVGEVALYNGALSGRRITRHFALGQQVFSDPSHYRLVDPPVIA